MYSILCKLGHGSFGEVYHLKMSNGDEFALKVAATHKFQQNNSLDAEAKLMIKLCHPHLAQCCSYFLDRQYLYLVIELCRHGNLRDYIANYQTKKLLVPEDRVLLWLGQMADVLRYLHDSRIIHRDLKPDNIFLDEKQNVKVGDLGIARELDYTNQKLNTQTGTYPYMSPEILNGESYTSKADIWSLGCCIHEVMTLYPTFKADSIRDLVQKVSKGEIRHMPSIYQPITQELIHKIFTVKPKLRPDATDILYYVCQIQGKPYVSGPHKPMEKFQLDTKLLRKTLKDFEERCCVEEKLHETPRPVPLPRKKTPVVSTSEEEKVKNEQKQEIFIDESMTSSSSSETDLSHSSSKFMIDLADESRQMLTSKYKSDVVKKSEPTRYSNQIEDYDSLVTLYTRAQKVTYTKHYKAYSPSSSLSLDIKPDVIEAAKNVIKLFEHQDPNTLDLMLIKVMGLRDFLVYGKTLKDQVLNDERVI